MDHVDGLDRWAFCLTELRHPTETADAKLQKIGKGGRIRLTGSASAEHGGLAAVRMHDVETIEGPDTTEPAGNDQAITGGTDS